MVASTAQRPTLLVFSGADWCPWCIKLDQEVFQTPQFQSWAISHAQVEMLLFLRHSVQTAETVHRNEQLRSAYGVETFPTVVVIGPHGRELGRLGYLPGGAANFIAELEKIIA